jgi:hypothetical protein
MKIIIWQQFGAAIDMLENAITARLAGAKRPSEPDLQPDRPARRIFGASPSKNCPAKNTGQAGQAHRF